MSNKDCGHFISRRFDSVRFDEKNAHGQCQKCNRFEHGNQFAHSVYIDKLYGAGTSENLLQKSRMLSKRTKFDYEHLAIFFKEKLEKLTKKCRA